MRNMIVALLVALVTMAHAQDDPPKLQKFYTNLGIGPSSRNGAFFEAGATAVLYSKWIASLSLQRFEMSPKSLPSDYQRGYTIVLILPIPDEMPFVKMTSINLTMGKIFTLKRKLWVTMEAGPVVAFGEQITFTRQPIVYEVFYVTSNYAEEKQSKTGGGVIVKADLSWAVTPVAGLSFGAFANVNTVQSSVGLQFKLPVGWLNTRKKTANT